MAAQLGNKQKAYICGLAEDITSQTDAIWIGCETANSANRTQEAVECSDKGDTWAKFIAAKRAGTFEVTAYADNENAGQVEALNGLHINEKVYFAIAVDGANDFEDMEYGRCVVTGISDTNDFGAVSTRTISIQADGELEHYPEWEEDEIIDETPAPDSADAPEELVEEIPEEPEAEQEPEQEPEPEPEQEPVEELPEEVTPAEEPTEEPAAEEEQE